MAQYYQALVLDLKAEVAAGNPLEVGHLAEKSLVMTDAAFTATIDIEATLDDPQASPTWQVLDAGIAASDVVAVPGWVRAVRANTTAYTSGTPGGRVAGLL